MCNQNHTQNAWLTWDQMSKKLKGKEKLLVFMINIRLKLNKHMSQDMHSINELELHFRI